MKWVMNKNGRALLSTIALMTALWLLITCVSASENYLSSHNGPVNFSWSSVAARTFRDWCPWFFLFPLAVMLAQRFRFERRTWRRSLLVHFTACLLFSIAYVGVSILIYPGPFFFQLAPPPPPGFPSSPGPVTSRWSRPARPSYLMDTNAMAVSRPNNSPPPMAPTNNFPGPFGNPNASQPVRFLQMAMMRTQFTVPIYWCIICICWVISHIQEAGERERKTLELEASLMQANLQTLKMQLQPHFLFNTLNAISSLVHENPKVADDMIVALSQFLRTTLEISAQNEIPLRSEIQFVERYLEIQLARFGDRLKIRQEIDPAVAEALVPPLILQPLVENAIRYGIETRESGGTITIKATRKSDSLHLEILDDGDGLKDGQLLGARSGVGLSNTKARLQALYGEDHRFKLTFNQPAGACVKIELPFRLPSSTTRS